MNWTKNRLKVWRIVDNELEAQSDFGPSDRDAIATLIVEGLAEKDLIKEAKIKNRTKRG